MCNQPEIIWCPRLRLECVVQSRSVFAVKINIFIPKWLSSTRYMTFGMLILTCFYYQNKVPD